MNVKPLARSLRSLSKALARKQTELRETHRETLRDEHDLWLLYPSHDRNHDSAGCEWCGLDALIQPLADTLEIAQKEIAELRAENEDQMKSAAGHIERMMQAIERAETAEAKLAARTEELRKVRSVVALHQQNGCGVQLAAEAALARVREDAARIDPETLGGNCAACHGLGSDDNASFVCSPCCGTGWVRLIVGLTE